MAQFSYKARRRSGEVVQGVLDVADRAAALAQIERLGLFPVARGCRQGQRAAAADKPAAQKIELSGVLPPSLRAMLTRKRKPKLQELATFTQQLANLLQAGMPLTVALNSMTHLESKGIPKDVSANLRQEVMEGRSLSDAMGKQPLIFSDLYVNMVKAGEQSGALVEVLRRMADHFEQFAEVQAKFTAALIYPAFVGVRRHRHRDLFHDFMLPKFMTMFGNMNVQLPHDDADAHRASAMCSPVTGGCHAVAARPGATLCFQQIPEHGGGQAQDGRVEDESADRSARWCG